MSSNVNITRLYGIVDIKRNHSSGLYRHASPPSDLLLAIPLDFTIGYIGRVC